MKSFVKIKNYIFNTSKINSISLSGIEITVFSSECICESHNGTIASIECKDEEEAKHLFDSFNESITASDI